MAQHPLFDTKQCTLAELIELGASYLKSANLVYGHGTDNAVDESAWLSLEACGYSPVEALSDYNVQVNKGHLERAKVWFIRRVENREPVAYITGRAWFAGLEFMTDTRALIPRSPLAELIHSEYQPWLTDTPRVVLDLCCGGGCIAVATAMIFPNASVHASDLSAEALQLAAINVQKHKLEGRLHLYKSDVFESLPNGERYDLIVSNPPYVDKPDMDSLPAEYQHEPMLGLAAGNQGLDLIDKIITGAAARLTVNGVLIVEVGNSQAAVEFRYSQLDMIWLDFELGGAGVFVTTAPALQEFSRNLSE